MLWPLGFGIPRHCSRGLARKTASPDLILPVIIGQVPLRPFFQGQTIFTARGQPSHL